MKRWLLIILSLILCLQIAHACGVHYDAIENVTVYDAIESYGQGSDCNLTLYYNNTFNQSGAMDRNGLAYSYEAGVLSDGLYIANIECNKSNSTYISECKFEVDHEGENMAYIAIIGAVGFVAFLFLISTFTMSKKNELMKIMSYFFAVALTIPLLYLGYRFSAMTSVTGLNWLWNVLIVLVLIIIIVFGVLIYIRLQKKQIQEKELSYDNY